MVLLVEDLRFSLSLEAACANPAPGSVILLEAPLRPAVPAVPTVPAVPAVCMCRAPRLSVQNCRFHVEEEGKGQDKARRA